jgi:hypothetical protein
LPKNILRQIKSYCQTLIGVDRRVKIQYFEHFIHFLGRAVHSMYASVIGFGDKLLSLKRNKLSGAIAKISSYSFQKGKHKV